MIRAWLIIGVLSIFCSKPSIANDCDTALATTEDSSQAVGASPLLYQFDSGASWSMCWHIDNDAGLILSQISYAAPDTQPRLVMDALSIGQLLFRYDEDLHASHLLSNPGLGATQHQGVSVDSCSGGALLSDTQGFHICQQVRQVNHLTDARRIKPLMRHELSLHSYSRVGTHEFEQVFGFSEDGEINPSLIHSGKISRFTDDSKFGIRLPNVDLMAASASVLVNWRMDFNIDGTASNDRVDEFEFLAPTADDGARPMTISRLETETARTINNQTFRGWRISDETRSSGTTSANTRIGYYLDPQTAGFGYVSSDAQWPNADFTVTAKHTCERLASFNHLAHPDCRENLDAYLNNESLEDANIVTWFSVSHQFSPQAEDFPAILARRIGFKLIPFDWTRNSTFVSEPEDASPLSGGNQ